jgi:hypothetical protein
MSWPRGTFPFTADGAKFPEQVIDFRICSVPARSTRSAANLYVQVAGVALFEVDPDWDGDQADQWFRGELAVTMPHPVLQQGDTLVEWTAMAGMRHLVRDEEGSTDDFGIAVDEVSSISTATGDVGLILKAGYQGDAWVPKVSFLLDLLIYRPSLDSVAQSQPRDRLGALAKISSVLLEAIGG